MSFAPFFRIYCRVSGVPINQRGILSVLFFITIITIFWLPINAQNDDKKALERQRKQLYREIEAAQKLLKNTQKDRKASLNDLVLLEKKITSRETLINGINREIDFLKRNMSQTAKQIDSLETRLGRFKDEYAASVKQSHLSENNYNKLLYLFSARDMNDAYRRMRYLQYYRRHRKKQIDQIVEMRSSLLKKQVSIKTEKQEQEALLKNEKEEQLILEAEKKDKDRTVASLKKKEKGLKNAISLKQRDMDDLNRQIREMIAAATRSEGSNKKRILNAEETKLSENFSQNKGKLSWPVEQGVVTERFGTHPHPVFKNIAVSNNGIDIATEPDSDVKAIFNGKVTNVLFNPTFQWAVIVNHGEFFTVYAKLRQVYVAKGDKIANKQLIGSVFSNDSEGKTEVHLEIWQGAQKMNPSEWLRQ